MSGQVCFWHTQTGHTRPSCKMTPQPVGGCNLRLPDNLTKELSGGSRDGGAEGGGSPQRIEGISMFVLWAFPTQLNVYDFPQQINVRGYHSVWSLSTRAAFTHALRLWTRWLLWSQSEDSPVHPVAHRSLGKTHLVSLYSLSRESTLSSRHACKVCSKKAGRWIKSVLHIKKKYHCLLKNELHFVVESNLIWVNNWINWIFMYVYVSLFNDKLRKNWLSIINCF